MKTIFVSLILGLSVNVASAEEAPTVDPQALCEFYADTFRFSGSAEAAMKVVPLTQDHAKQFKALLEKDEKKVAKKATAAKDFESGVITFQCSGTTLAIIGEKQKIEIDFAQVANSKLVINGKELDLSLTKEVESVSILIDRILNGKSNKAALLLEKILPHAFAQGVISQVVNGDQTLGWRRRSGRDARHAATLVAVSAPALRSVCNTNSTVGYVGSFLPTSSNMRSALCSNRTAMRVARYSAGFENFRFRCQRGKLSNVQWEISDFREGQANRTRSIDIEYSQLGGVRRVVSRSSVPHLRCVYRFTEDGTVVELNGDIPCLADTADEEYLGNFLSRESTGDAQVDTYGTPVEGSAPTTFSRWNRYSQQERVITYRVNTNIAGGTDPSTGKPLDPAAYSTVTQNPPRSSRRLLNPAQLRNVSPIANIPLLQSCCNDADCPTEFVNIMRANGRSDATIIDRSPRRSN